MFRSHLAIRAAILAATAAATVAVAACTDSASSTSSSPTISSSTASSSARTDFNGADVTFLQEMNPHHAQAVDMAKLVAARSQNPQVITLAQGIERAQGPEMTQMTGLLEGFGKAAPAPEHSGGHGDMPGMMSAEQMGDLSGLSGASFDKVWLQMMIDHHTGAIEMAAAELRDGTNPEVKKLAEAIIGNQKAEITQMRGMLGQS